MFALEVFQIFGYLRAILPHTAPHTNIITSSFYYCRFRWDTNMAFMCVRHIFAIYLLKYLHARRSMSDLIIFNIDFHVKYIKLIFRKLSREMRVDSAGGRVEVSAWQGVARCSVAAAAVTGRGRKSKGNTLISGIKFQFAACALCLRRTFSISLPLVLIQFAAHFYDLSLRLRRDTCLVGSTALSFSGLIFLPASMFRPPLSLTRGLWLYFVLVTERQRALEIFHLGTQRGRQHRAHRFINAVA